MDDLNSKSFSLLRRQHGHVTVEQLNRAGVGRNAQRRLVGQGILRPVHKTVLQIPSAPNTLESRCASLCLAHPDGFITGPTAGKLLGLRRMPKAEPIHFSVAHGTHLRQLEGVTLRQSTRIIKLDWMRREDGIVIASGPRLAFDLARDLKPGDHASVVEQLLAISACTTESLGATARRLCQFGRRGSVQFARTLLERGDRPAAESHPELVLADFLRRRGVPVQPQYADLPLPNGASIRIDLAVPQARWGIEIDIHPDHLLLEGTTKDKRRDRQCHLIGWQVERVTQIDFLDLNGLADELELLYLARIRAVA